MTPAGSRMVFDALAPLVLISSRATRSQGGGALIDNGGDASATFLQFMTSRAMSTSILFRAQSRESRTAFNRYERSALEDLTLR